MELLRMAVKDLVRRRGKSIYLLIAVVIPVAILSTILLTLDNADSTLAGLASKFGFTLSIQPKNIKPERIDQVGVVLGEVLPEQILDTVLTHIAVHIEDRDEAVITSPRLYEKTELTLAGRVVNGPQ